MGNYPNDTLPGHPGDKVALYAYNVNSKISGLDRKKLLVCQYLNPPYDDFEILPQIEDGRYVIWKIRVETQGTAIPFGNNALTFSTTLGRFLWSPSVAAKTRADLDMGMIALAAGEGITVSCNKRFQMHMKFSTRRLGSTQNDNS